MKKNCSAGEGLNAWCPRCTMQSEHTIISIIDNAPKRIKCNTCEEHHTWSAKLSGKSHGQLKSTGRRERSKEALYKTYLTRLAESDPAHSIKYTIKGNFEKDQIIEHITFGIGLVLSVIQENKIEILFKDGPRLLIQNQ
ncbi:MAG: hypothetical protein JSU99_09690 [Nitrospiraceae bacterium]|nr:MAG: hypothetical protein JSU99_09690 [Nitrospiraceae bacterium]